MKNHVSILQQFSSSSDKLSSRRNLERGPFQTLISSYRRVIPFPANTILIQTKVHFPTFFYLVLCCCSGALVGSLPMPSTSSAATGGGCASADPITAAQHHPMLLPPITSADTCTANAGWLHLDLMSGNLI